MPNHRARCPMVRHPHIHLLAVHRGLTERGISRAPPIRSSAIQSLDGIGRRSPIPAAPSQWERYEGRRPVAARSSYLLRDRPASPARHDAAPDTHRRPANVRRSRHGEAAHQKWHQGMAAAPASTAARRIGSFRRSSRAGRETTGAHKCALSTRIQRRSAYFAVGAPCRERSRSRRCSASRTSSRVTSSFPANDLLSRSSRRSPPRTAPVTRAPPDEFEHTE